MKPCVNPAGPSAKAKYVKRPIVDQYCEGKVKRTPNRGVKKTLKPCAYKRLESRLGEMTACLLHNEPTSYTSLARLRTWMSEAEAKASLNRAFS